MPDRVPATVSKQYAYHGLEPGGPQPSRVTPLASDFDGKLPRQLRLRTGRIVATLSDATVLIGELPEFPMLRPEWGLACEAIRHAAKTKDLVDMETAACELELALIRDGLLDGEIGRRQTGNCGRPHAAHEQIACRKCNRTMGLARKLPKFGALPELWTFVCKECGEVETCEVERVESSIVLRRISFD